MTDHYVVAQPGERVSNHNTTDWLVSDSDDSEGRQRLVDHVRRAGGILVAA
ncbi:MAG: hypothetical protein ACYC2H_00245 [Thermoplasmatota archaeon]